MIFEQEVSIFEKGATVKRFKANETSIGVVQGKISALISESELIELQNGRATMYSRLANAEMTVSRLQLDFSDLTTKYDTVTGQYTALDSKVAQYKAGVDGLSANLTKVSTKLETDYSTTTQMQTAISASANTVKIEMSNTVTEKLKDYSTTAQMQAAIKMQTDSIVLEVRQKVGTNEVINAINTSAEGIKIKGNKIELIGNVSITSFTEAALKEIKGYSSTAEQNAKKYTLEQIAALPDASGNLLKGTDLSSESLEKYWDCSGSIAQGYNDPMGGTKAVRLYGTSGDNFISAKYKNNNPVTTAGRYEIRIWLKSNTAGTVMVSLNRKTYTCSLTTQWKQYKFVDDVTIPNTQGLQNFTIGGFGSVTSAETVYVYKPEVIFGYTSADIMAMLTNNGAMQGIFLANNQLYIKGSFIDIDDLKTLKATIGGFEIGNTYIANGCMGLTSSNQGVYVGTDGIRLNAKNNRSFTFDVKKGEATFVNAKVGFNGGFDTGYITAGAGGAITCKYGLHVYTNRNGDFSDGSSEPTYFSEFVLKGLPTASSGTHLIRESGSAVVAALSSSSKRYKDHIALMETAEAEKLLEIPVVWFKYKQGYLEKRDRFANKAIPGFYAEDVYQAFPEAAQLNPDGTVEDWNYRMMIPTMLKLIQEMHKEIKALKSGR